MVKPLGGINNSRVYQALKSTKIMNLNEKIQEHFYHWVWGNNFIRGDEPSYLINLELGLSIRFDYKEGFFASYEDFIENIADIQFMLGDRPDDEDELERILTDAWNYLGIEERIADGFGLEGIDDVNLF